MIFYIIKAKPVLFGSRLMYEQVRRDENGGNDSNKRIITKFGD